MAQGFRRVFAGFLFLLFRVCAAAVQGFRFFAVQGFPRVLRRAAFFLVASRSFRRTRWLGVSALCRFLLCLWFSRGPVGFCGRRGLCGPNIRQRGGLGRCSCGRLFILWAWPRALLFVRLRGSCGGPLLAEASEPPPGSPPYLFAALLLFPFAALCCPLLPSRLRCPPLRARLRFEISPAARAARRPSCIFLFVCREWHATKTD